jgi:hypothetical protein
VRNYYREQHGDAGTPCFWSKTMLWKLRCLSKQLFSELVASNPENHRMIADARALVGFFEAITKGTHDDDDFYD